MSDTRFADVADVLEHLLRRVGETVSGEHTPMQAKVDGLRGDPKPTSDMSEAELAAHQARPAAVSDERGTPADRVAALEAQERAIQAQLAAARTAAAPPAPSTPSRSTPSSDPVSTSTLTPSSDPFRPRP